MRQTCQVDTKVEQADRVMREWLGGTASAGVRSMPHTDFALSSTLVANQPRCRRCGETMQLVRLVPIPPNMFVRTFECQTCDIAKNVDAKARTNNGTAGVG
jgi:hypothetical protein